jgi:glycosyltransferase involved in cell wall biosynthesis
VSDGDLIIQRAGADGPRLLFVEPYLTPSHAAFMQGLTRQVPARWTCLGLAGRYWRWRMRGAASYLASVAQEILAQPWDALVCSDMLGLAELRGLAPGLARVPSLVVFHENQLAYPAPGRAEREQQKRDLFLAWSNLSSAQAAEAVVFNSQFHRGEFLQAARQLLARLPDMQPPGLVKAIEAKSLVLPIPIDVDEAAGLEREPRQGPLRLVWNHRWDHDKDPKGFFEALFMLARQGCEFEVAVLGQRPASWPESFDRAPEKLGTRLVHLGPAERSEYWKWLFWGDVVVSTAKQEYFGLAVAEAVWAGCRPLLPHTLVYPELYPAEHLYSPGGLAQALEDLLAKPEVVRAGSYRNLAKNFTWQAQRGAWRDILYKTTGKGGAHAGDHA